MGQPVDFTARFDGPGALGISWWEKTDGARQQVT
jgi:hypothetical protein